VTGTFLGFPKSTTAKKREKKATGFDDLGISS
jgi:hypothetical protein